MFDFASEQILRGSKDDQRGIFLSLIELALAAFRRDLDSIFSGSDEIESI